MTLFFFSSRQPSIILGELDSKLTSYRVKGPANCRRLSQTRPKFDDHIAIQTMQDSQPVLIPAAHFSTKPDISLTIER